MTDLSFCRAEIIFMASSKLGRLMDMCGNLLSLVIWMASSKSLRLYLYLTKSGWREASSSLELLLMESTACKISLLAKVTRVLYGKLSA